MPIRDPKLSLAWPLAVSRVGNPALLAGLVLATCLGLAGCGKNAAQAAIETDAHGYQCQKCAAKYFTGPKVFLESKCPKCGEEGLVDVIGYWCEKDQHMTIRPKVSGPQGASVCGKCGDQLKNAMISPRAKDLMMWGASKTGPI